MVERISVALSKTTEGLSLVTADEYKDILVGPLTSYADILAAAKELDLQIITPTRASVHERAVGALEIGDLFRIERNWYRFKRKEGKNCIVDVVGEAREMAIPASSSTSELSVLSIQ